jgi:hypothetical protein
MVGTHTENGHSRTAKIILEWKPMGSRPLGRPRLRWFDNVCDDQKVLKVRNWKELATDRKVSYTMGTGGPFPRGKGGRSVKLTTHTT